MRMEHLDKLYENRNHGSIELPIQVYHISIEDGFYLSPHIHKEFELFVMKEGDGIFYVDDREYELKEGDGIFVPSRCIHFGKKKSIASIQFYAIVFSSRFLGSEYHDKITDSYITPVLEEKIHLTEYLERNNEWQKQILSICDEICETYSKKELGYEIRLKYNCLRIWELLFLHGEETKQDKIHIHLNKIKGVLEFMEENYGEKISLEQLASQCHMSKEHFERTFHAIMYTTPFVYLTDIRLSKSCTMLRTTSKSISEIAQSCGFFDASYFSRMFRKHYQVSPNTYRKQC